MPSPDPWASLRATTRARIGLGRTGDAPPLPAVLDFQLAHARARDAVHTPLDVEAIASGVSWPASPASSSPASSSPVSWPAHGRVKYPTTSAGHPRLAEAASAAPIIVHSAAPDRATYLRRPDLGRRLSPESRAQLAALPRPTDAWDAVFVIADGLSATGVQQFAVPLLHACLDRLPGWSIAPMVIATQARVALGDEIGEVLAARLCAVLIGERPGLSVANSVGVYLTYAPQLGRQDSQRNCVSNIHPDGLSFQAAAEMVTWLMTEARHRKLTGVELKAERVVAAPATTLLPLDQYPASR